MIERLNIVEERFNEIVKELENPDTLNDYNKLMKLNKEKSEIEETVIKWATSVCN